MSISKEHYRQLLHGIHCKSNAGIIEKVYEIIKPHSDTIATHFYNMMLNNPKAKHFINHDIVKTRLHSSLKNWIDLSLLYKYDNKMIDEYIDYQLHIGHIHGRINLPISFVDYGMYILKTEISKILKQSGFERGELAEGLIIINQIFDLGLALMNESYQGDLVFNEKEAQAFKLQFSTQNLARDCERLRTSLANWMREFLLTIQQENFDISQASTLRHSDFGLWIVHKAKLFLTRSDYESLLQLLDDMDEKMEKLIANFADPEKRKENLLAINVFISKALWILDDIAKDIIDKDNGRDPLTRLFNRRYLDTVLRHETECSLKNDSVFGLLMLDIDFFKQINDTFGHDNGDLVLEQLADILSNNIRAGDFVFRLGGEEFLIVLSDINEKFLEKVGNKLRKEIEENVFILKEKQELSVTISVGVAMHDGHPDFKRTLKLADEALYDAKHSGRNCVIVAKIP